MYQVDFNKNPIWSIYYIQHLLEQKMRCKSCYSFSQSMQLGYSVSLQRIQRMHGRPNCSLGWFYLLEGTNLARNILGQTPSTLILLALCSIFSFLCFISSFSSFFFQLSSSYTELLSILLWYKYPSPDIFTQVNDWKKQHDTVSSPPQGNAN